MSIRPFVPATLTLVLLLVPLAASSARADGCEPTFEPLAMSRILPHAYVDQGLESLPHVYPTHVLLLQRRASSIGGVRYSLLVYKKERAVDSVTIEGVAVSGKKAWRFTATCSSDLAMQGLVTTLERIAALPTQPKER